MKYIISRVLGWIVLILMLLAVSNGMHAQNVVLKGNTFVQQTTTKSDSIATSYFYQDAQGVKYPVFLSQKGKAFVWVFSKAKYDDKGNLLKPAHSYKRYLSKITEELAKRNIIHK